MGAHYARWLIARGNSFSPAAASVVKLVERLKKEKWIPEAGGHAVTTIDNTFGSDLAAKRAASTEPQPAPLTAEWLDDEDREELRLVWPASGEAGSPVKYPLSQRPEGKASYSLEVHRAAEYVYPTARTIGMVPTVCNCKEDLSFEWDEEELVPAFGNATGIFAECEECSRTFEPSKGSAIITNPFDRSTEEVRGGAAYRFALVVECGECFVEDAKLAFAPDLVALVENEFGRSFYEVGALY
ncbi:MAG TPA: hypothetical protein VLT33_40950 [Labilithrix sp.]|nr:hypothetical protein [Labilithrix sp.]